MKKDENGQAAAVLARRAKNFVVIAFNRTGWIARNQRSISRNAAKLEDALLRHRLAQTPK